MEINWRNIELEPKATCRQVDVVLEMLDNVESYIKDIREEMEKVRSQNKELREWGASAIKELERIEAELGQNQQGDKND